MLHPISKRTLLAPLVLMVALAACSDSPSGIEPGPHADPVGAVIYDRDTGAELADTHGDHWHGSLQLEAGQEIEIDVLFLDADGQEVAFDGDHTLGVRLGDGAANDVVTFDVHGDHVDIDADADAAGETALVFEFLHDGHVEYETPALQVTVGEGAAAGPPVDAVVYDRDSGDELADTHGAHWHGGLQLEVGQEIEIDVVFLNEDGEEVAIGGHHTLQVRYGDEAANDVVTFDVHGDHVDIDADAAGETALVFEFLHDDHVEYETPPLTVEVQG